MARWNTEPQLQWTKFKSRPPTIAQQEPLASKTLNFRSLSRTCSSSELSTDNRPELWTYLIQQEGGRDEGDHDADEFLEVVVEQSSYQR